MFAALFPRRQLGGVAMELKKGKNYTRALMRFRHEILSPLLTVTFVIGVSSYVRTRVSHAEFRE